MLIIGIDPGISGSICFFEDGKILEVIEMPVMTDGKKNKKQVNGAQIYNEITKRIKQIDKNEISDEDILELAIDAGANECKSDKEFHEIQCSINDIYNVKKELEKKISNFISTGIEWVPLNAVEIPNERKDELINFFETLEDNDDVQNIFTNAKFIN